jgi:uncharacterized protein YyaL (SSP411 family)
VATPCSSDPPCFRVLSDHEYDRRYDQAQLAANAIDFALISSAEGEEGDAKVCFDLAANILEYSLRDLLSDKGGFYSAEDADSALKKGDKKSGIYESLISRRSADADIEGAFYIWSKEEFDEILGEDAKLLKYVLGVKVDGNVSGEHDAHGEMTGMVSVSLL